ncbi:MucBP domain-containing protein [Enterococcus sp. AZ128]|uniref:MucBP domain-containing protein n=3 Tax=Enterococcus TaxID=1350 RepID=UPI003F68693A
MKKNKVILFLGILTFFSIGFISFSTVLADSDVENNLLFLKDTKDVFPEILSGNQNNISSIDVKRGTFDFNENYRLTNWEYKTPSYYTGKYGSVSIRFKDRNDSVALKYKDGAMYKGKLHDVKVVISQVNYRLFNFGGKRSDFNFPVVNISNNFYNGFVFHNADNFKVTISFLDKDGSEITLDNESNHISFNSLYPQGEYVKYQEKPQSGTVSEGSFVRYDLRNQAYYGGSPSKDYVDSIGSPTFKKASVMFPVSGKAQNFIGGTTNFANVWFSPSSASVYLPKPDLKKSISDDDEKDVESNTLLAGKEMSYSLTHYVPILGSEILQKYSNLTISDILPEKVEYLDAYYADENGQKMENAGEIVHNKESRQVTFTANKDLLENRLQYAGKNYKLIIKVRLMKNVSEKNKIENTASIITDNKNGHSNKVVTTPIMEGSVVTKYVDEDGKEISSQNKTTGEVGSEYTTIQKEIPGYSIKEVPANKDGKYTDGVTTVTYVYTKDEEPTPVVEGSVVTKYVDEDGKEISSQNKTTGEVGSEYTTIQKEIPGYSIKEVPANKDGKYTDGVTTVTYVYTKDEEPTPVVEGSVVTKYVDEDGKEISSQNKTTGEVGSEYTTIQKEIPGYSIKEVPANKDGKYTDGVTTVTYVYTKDEEPTPVVEGSVVTKYVDEDGKEISSQNKTTGEVGSEYTTIQKEIPGYSIKEVPANKDGKYTDGVTTVTYVYTKDEEPTPVVEGSVVTKYVDEDGKEISSQNKTTGEVGSEYTTIQKEIPGYSIKEVPANKDGKYTDGVTTVTYVYTKDEEPTPVVEGSVVTKYVDEDGKEISSQNKTTGEVGSEYTTIQKEIPGYSIKEVPANKDGKYTDGVTTVTYVYTKDEEPTPVVEGSVVTKYVDEDGKEISSQNKTTGEVGSEYTTIQKEIPGYSIKEVPANKDGKYTDGVTTVTYVYTKDEEPTPVVEGSVVTKYVDEDGKEISSQNKTTGEVGSEYTTIQKEIPGYSIKEVPANKDGKYTDGVTTVTYVYTKDEEPTPVVEGSVVTKYVDEDGKEISSQNKTTGEVGSEYTTIQKEIPGYSIKEVPANKDGKYTDGVTTVTYVYTKDEEPTPVVEGSVVTKYVDEDGKEISSQNKTTGEVGSEYTTIQKEIPGYSIKEVPANKDGKYTDGVTTVTYVYTKDEEPTPVVEGSVVTKYVDEDGKEISSQNKTTGEVGSEYTTIQKEIPGYSIKEVPANKDGKYTDGVTTVTYVYTKDEEPTPVVEGSVVTKYVDEDGKEISSQNKTTGEVGSEYTTIQKEIPGYSIKEVPANKDGKYTDGVTTVTYVYTKGEEPTPVVEGSDKKSNSNLETRHVSSVDSSKSSFYKKNLPKTGDRNHLWLSYLGVVLLLIILSYTFSKKVKKCQGPQ